MESISLKRPSKREELQNILRDKIMTGAFSPKGLFPSQNKLALAYEVSHVTVREAVGMLVHEGLLIRIHGKGTFVTDFNAQKNKTKTLAVLIPQVNNPFYSKIVYGIEKKANELGYDLLLCNTDGNDCRENEYVKKLVGEGKVDGFLVCPGNPSFQSDVINALRRVDIPFVVFPQLEMKETEDISYVVCDDSQGINLAIKSLIDLGHRNIGLLTWRSSTNNFILNNRLNAYKCTLNKAGLKFRNKLVLCAENTNQDDGFRMAFKLAEMKKRPTAVSATSDSLAIGFLNGLRECGIKVPEDIALIGFDDIDLASQSHIQLTTVAQPTYEIGYRSVEVLIDKLEGRNDKHQQIVLSPELIVRKTSGDNKFHK